jgi:hypothetical protein
VQNTRHIQRLQQHPTTMDHHQQPHLGLRNEA